MRVGDGKLVGRVLEIRRVVDILRTREVGQRNTYLCALHGRGVALTREQTEEDEDRDSAAIGSQLALTTSHRALPIWMSCWVSKRCADEVRTRRVTYLDAPGGR